MLQAAYLNALVASHVRWHLPERTLAALLKATQSSLNLHILQAHTVLTSGGMKPLPKSVSEIRELLQAAYLDALVASHVHWHLPERTLGALLKAKPELWDLYVATAQETGANSPSRQSSSIVEPSITHHPSCIKLPTHQLQMSSMVLGASKLEELLDSVLSV